MALSKKPLKIFHTSDIHLGAYDKKSGRFSDENKIKQEKNFIRLIDIGIASKADVFLIPGDLFDNARVDQETLELFAEQINRIDKLIEENGHVSFSDLINGKMPTSGG